MGNGVFLIKSREQFLTYAANNAPLYVQEYLPSNRDLRVCVAGNEVFASYWRIAENGEFHHNVARGGQLSFASIPDEALHLAYRVARTLDINHAGFDILYSNGHPCILEFNVLYGNQGLREQGLSVEKKIYEFLLAQVQPPFPTAPLTPSAFERKRIS